jgi:hypothetical protein
MLRVRPARSGRARSSLRDQLAHLPGLQQRVDLHQRLVGVAPAEAGDDLVDAPVELRAVEQHHRGVLAAVGLVARAALDRDRRTLHVGVPQLADVGGHQHVRVHVHGAAVVLAQRRDREAREAELGIGLVARVLRDRRQRVVDRAHFDPAPRVPRYRVREHAEGQLLAAVAAAEHSDRIGLGHRRLVGTAIV